MFNDWFSTNMSRITALSWSRLTSSCYKRHLLLRRAAEADGVGDVIEFFAADFFEAFAFGGEVLIYLDYFLGHLFVRFLFAADERKIRTRGDAFVTIRVEADAEHQCFDLLFSFLRFGHFKNLDSVRPHPGPLPQERVMRRLRPVNFTPRCGASAIEEKSFACHTGTVSCLPLSDGPRLRRKGIAILAHSSGMR